MKRILVTAANLDIGGIETSLINLLKSFDYDKYDVTLVLEHAKGIFLDMVPKEVHIIDYGLSDDKNIIRRKITNRSKLIKWQKNNKNKYDFAISFATYSFVGARIALNASINNAIWIHGDYYTGFDKDIKKLNNFFSKIMLNKFKNVVFVAKSIKETTNLVYKIVGKQHVINNIIDGESIIAKSNDNINLTKDNIPTFLNVGRHEENQKRLLRILSACKKIHDEGIRFKLLMIGEGPDTNQYKEYVKENNLENDVLFLGKMQNPFPYYKIADAVVLSSSFEGYPVVFNEARVLGIPIITTKVSDYEDIEGKYGIVTEQEDIYFGLKDFITNGFIIKENFDYKKYNEDVLDKIYSIIE